MNLYSIGIAFSVIICSAAYVLLSSRCTERGSAVLVAGVSAVTGLLMSRLVFWLGAADFFIGRTHSMMSFFWWTDGGFSLFGAVIGAAGGAWLCCRWLKADPAAMDALALPVLLLVAEARLLEWTGHGMDFGASMDGPVWLTVAGEYSRKLNVALVEALLMALIAVSLMTLAGRRARRITLRDTLFLVGLSETLMISMRRDNYMMWGFVHQEQLYFYLLSAAMCIWAGFEAEQGVPSVIASFLTAGLIVLWEFGLDGRVHVPFAFLRDWADPFWYCLFVLTLVGYIVFYARLRRAERVRACSNA